MASPTYRKLDPTAREIRILHLLPSSQPESEIECTLSHATLGDNPPYTALSYEWNETGPRTWLRRKKICKISLEGVQVEITPNLHAALFHLRSQCSSPMALWVDALCINQADLSERSEQVTQMASIYSGARETVAWLGTFENCGLAAELMEFIVTEKDNDRLRTCYQTFDFAKHWTAMFHLMASNNYWIRLWIVQEVVLSKALTFHYSSGTFTWHHLCSLTRLLDFEGYKTLRSMIQSVEEGKGDGKRKSAGDEGDDHDSEDEVDYDHMGIAWASIIMRIKPLVELHDDLNGGRRIPLLEALRRTSHKEMSDPLDRVYGLQGMTSGPVIIPDYGTTTKRLFQQVVMHIVHQTSSLDILSFLEREENLHFIQLHKFLVACSSEQNRQPPRLPDGKNPLNGLDRQRKSDDFEGEYPSWVPFFYSDDFFDVFGYSNKLYIGRENTLDYNATGKSEPQIRQEDDILNIRGVVFQEVIYADDQKRINQDVIGLDKCVSLWRQVWQAISQHHPHPNLPGGHERAPYGSQSQKLEALQATAICGLDLEGEGGLNAKEQFRNFLESVVVAGEDLADRRILVNTQLDEGKFCFQSSRFRFFVTAGGYIGVGPPIAQKGDVVAFFPGARVPFVLRPYGVQSSEDEKSSPREYYYIVGDACKSGPNFNVALKQLLTDLKIYMEQ